MGQYFKAINLDKLQCVEPDDYGNGLKLMEHSWLRNPFMNVVMGLLTPGGSWYANRLVWAGDYMKSGLFLKGLKGRRKDDTNLYQCSLQETGGEASCIKPIRPQLQDGPVPLYLANHDTLQFVELANLPEEFTNNPGWHIHQLSLLTCASNGEGLGDFNGENDHTGSWAGGHVSAEYLLPEGFSRISPGFTERP